MCITACFFKNKSRNLSFSNSFSFSFCSFIFESSKSFLIWNQFFAKYAISLALKSSWQDINSNYDDFITYLLRGLANKGYSLNYQGAIIAKLRNVMNEGFLLKYHTNYDYKKFKKPSEQADTIYLTKEEVNALWKIKLTAPLEQKARDLFLLGVFTASRYSDYSILSTDNIKGSTLEFIQKKTGGKVILPLSPKVEEILLFAYRPDYSHPLWIIFQRVFLFISWQNQDKFSSYHCYMYKTLF